MRNHATARLRPVPHSHLPAPPPSRVQRLLMDNYRLADVPSRCASWGFIMLRTQTGSRALDQPRCYASYSDTDQSTA